MWTQPSVSCNVCHGHFMLYVRSFLMNFPTLQLCNSQFCVILQTGNIVFWVIWKLLTWFANLRCNTIPKQLIDKEQRRNSKNEWKTNIIGRFVPTKSNKYCFQRSYRSLSLSFTRAKTCLKPCTNTVVWDKIRTTQI